MTGYEPIYMHKPAITALREWPDYFAPAENASPVNGLYDWLVEANVIATPWVERDCDGGPVLTQVGVFLKGLLDGQSYNFFTIPQVLDIWPIDLLANRRPDIGEYLRLFQVDWNDQDVRRYISKRLKDNDDKHALTYLSINPCLLSDLEAAAIMRERATYHMKMLAWKWSPDTEDIPF